jgi:amino acid transporter
MIVFERLFATYYFFFVRKRNFQRKIGLKGLLVERSEDMGALALLATSQFLIAMLVFGLLISKYELSIGLTVFVTFLFYALLILSQYFYFIQNRQRRRKVIEEFREVPFANKVFWSVIAACIFVGPICLFPILFTK